MSSDDRSNGVKMVTVGGVDSCRIRNVSRMKMRNWSAT
jgi:hypothetical protein